MSTVPEAGAGVMPFSGTQGKSPFVELFDCADAHATRLGGKGASLCRLVANGNLVPPGFVVSIEAFERVMEELDLAGSIQQIDEQLAKSLDPANEGDEIVRRLRAGRVSADVLEPVLEAVASLGLWSDTSAGVIVRSSATVEDSSLHSFAGIFESVPITSPAEFEPMMREIWASVFSARALSYYREVGLVSTPKMALVIQRFISADRSGVMFTTYGGKTLVEHVEGGCEKLVKGEVTPERLWLSRADRRPESKTSLSANHVQELGRLAANLEEKFGCPQDVEWVLFDDRIHVVQSRPVTTALLSTPTVEPRPSGLDGAEPVLRGTGASGGWGSGNVHLAFNIEDALAISSGEVLVTPMTNPDMVVAMRKSAAIVTDVGGIICHAAIVSRELGLPCVVGTVNATTILGGGDLVTVSGGDGTVYRGTFDTAHRDVVLDPVSWTALWACWARAAAPRPETVPIVPTIEALNFVPTGIGSVLLIPDIDLRCDGTGLWADLQGMPPIHASAHIDDYLARLDGTAERRGIARLCVRARDRWLAELIRERVEVLQLPRVRVEDQDSGDSEHFELPLVFSTERSDLSGMAEARMAAQDTIKFFGHEPGSHRSHMPRPESRRKWWELLPEYERFHAEFGTAREEHEFSWLEIRPELVISPLLKSFVQPGFEMVPRVMGFSGLPPMHVKWQRCRYHFRSDTFAKVWEEIVRATWDPGYMADMLRRVRASYANLESVLVLFPASDAARASLSTAQIEALITAWWPRWVEFFALCWFIQAQGDDVLYPFIEETVRDNLRSLGDARSELGWPGPQDLVAPTTPVMSGEYMADVMKLRQTLLSAGLDEPEKALSVFETGGSPALSEAVASHLAKWHWMRDRDLLFEPWDSPERVIRTALDTGFHSAPDYGENLRRQLLALAVHSDLARRSGRSDGLHHAVRFLHDLNVERENHHVLWLKYSYPLRQLVLEVERRLIAAGSLSRGEIFFMQAPELIAAVRSLPDGLPDDLVRTVRNRRAAFRHEARLEVVGEQQPHSEDDYY